MDRRSEEKLIRLVLVDDQNLSRTGLARLLGCESGLEVVGECGSCAEALEVLKNFPADVVLLDFNVGPENAVAFITAAHAAGWHGQFLIVAGAADARALARALSLGASGIFLKSGGPDRLVQAIRLVSMGAAWIDQKMIQLLAEQWVSQPPRAGERRPALRENQEEKVISGIIDGLTNKKIACEMGLSESSVKNILQGLFSKTGVRTRSQLVCMAVAGSLGDVEHQFKADNITQGIR